MKEKKKIRFYRWIIGCIFLIGIVIIARYHFQQRDLTVIVRTDQGNFSFKFSNVQTRDSDNFSFDFPQMQQLKVKEVRIYRQFKSICLQKIHFDNLTNYLLIGNSSSFEWTKDGVSFFDEDRVHLVLNNAGAGILKSIASTLLLERILAAGWWMVFCVVILAFCEVYQERDVNNRYKNHSPMHEVKRFYMDMKKYWTYMTYSAKADLRAEVANSYLNRLWWLLEPFFSMLVYVIVFGRVMGRSVENYATFTFSALMMWSFFSKTINYSVKLIRNNRDIVTKVYVPKFVLLVSNMILNFCKLLFSLIVLIPMLLIFKVHVGINIFWVVPAYAVMILLSFGLGMIFLNFGVYVDDLSYAVGILLQMMMFLSGVFYEVMTSLSSPLNIIMMCLNPAAAFIDTMRNALLDNTAANVPILALWGVISIIFCCIGVHIVYKNENGYVKVV